MLPSFEESIYSRRAGLHAHLGREVPDDEPVPLAVWAAVPWTDRLGRHFRRHGTHNVVAMAALAGGRDILARWAARCAAQILPAWEAAVPDDPAPRNAIDAGIRGVVVESDLVAAFAATRRRVDSAAAALAAEAAAFAAAAAFGQDDALTIANDVSAALTAVSAARMFRDPRVGGSHEDDRAALLAALAA